MVDAVKFDVEDTVTGPSRTRIAPVPAPVGTDVTIEVADSTVNGAATPLNVTPVTPTNPLPVNVTDTPGPPEVGANDEIADAAATVSVAAVVVTVPAVFTNTARNCLPLSAAAAVKPYVVAVAPAMSDHVTAPAGRTCHCTVGAGVPDAAAVRDTDAPSVTEVAAGFVVIDGGRWNENAAGSVSLRESGLVTVTSTVPVGLAGAVHVSDVELVTTTSVQVAPPRVTVTVPATENPVPVMVTVVPPEARPHDGVIALTVGAFTVTVTGALATRYVPSARQVPVLVGQSRNVARPVASVCSCRLSEHVVSVPISWRRGVAAAVDCVDGFGEVVVSTGSSDTAMFGIGSPEPSTASTSMSTGVPGSTGTVGTSTNLTTGICSNTIVDVGAVSGPETVCMRPSEKLATTSAPTDPTLNPVKDRVPVAPDVVVDDHPG